MAIYIEDLDELSFLKLIAQVLGPKQLSTVVDIAWGKDAPRWHSFYSAWDGERVVIHVHGGSKFIVLNEDVNGRQEVVFRNDYLHSALQREYIREQNGGELRFPNQDREFIDQFDRAKALGFGI